MNETQAGRGSIVLGFLAGIGLAVVHAVIVLASPDLAVIFRGLRFFGLVQFVYMIPAFLFLLRRRPAMATGLAIAAGLVVVVNVIFSMMD